MDNEKKAKNRTSIFQKFKNLKNKEIIIAAVLGCIALIIFFSNFTGSGSSSSDSSGGTFSTEEYVTNLENKLSKILTKVDGAGKVSVMITVESGMEIVTATESGSEKPIIVNGKVVILKELYPKVKGVVIVAGGADSIKVKVELLNATVALLDVDPKAVEIYTMT